MKKTMIIALLVTLVLGVFTACNGDVNADIEEKNTVTFSIYNHGSDDWVFDNGTETMELNIPSGCVKWSDLIGKASISVKNSTSCIQPKTLDLKEYEGYACFILDEDDYIEAGIYFNSKKLGDDVLIDSEIVIDGTYTLSISEGK
jgi:hypothetical protein